MKHDGGGSNLVSGNISRTGTGKLMLIYRFLDSRNYIDTLRGDLFEVCEI